jgi:hypothetical protein
MRWNKTESGTCEGCDEAQLLGRLHRRSSTVHITNKRFVITAISYRSQQLLQQNKSTENPFCRERNRAISHPWLTSHIQIFG